MKTLNCCVAMLLLSQSSLATDQPFQLAASVVRDDQLVVQFDMQLPADKIVTVTAPGNVSLELRSSGPGARVRLLDLSSGQAKVMHTERSTDQVFARSITYTICGKHGAVMQSPAPPMHLACAHFWPKVKSMKPESSMRAPSTSAKSPTQR